MKSNIDILHIDMDAFFAAVEQLDDPSLKGKPVIVGGTNLSKRGVVATASYEARKFGVHSAMPIARARKLCPHGVYLPTRHNRYQQISKSIFKVFTHFTPRVEKISIDEAFLDISGCHRLFGSSVEIGNKIKDRIKKETGLTASIGIAPNKFLAKLASDLDKPAGFVVIRPEEIDEILEPLPISKIWGVGEKTEELLVKKGVKKIRDLKKIPAQELEKAFGKLGRQLYALARGEDDRKVQPVQETKSISHEETFNENLTDREEIYGVLLHLTEKVVRRLRKKQLMGSTVFIKIRYNNFKTYTRRFTLTRPRANVEDIYSTGKFLLEKYHLLDRPVRLLGIGIGNLQQAEKKQLSLFARQKKKENISSTIDSIKDRFGEDSIKRARNLIHNNDNK